MHLFNKRKRRSDKLWDIKFKLSADDKRQLQILAMDDKVSLTAFCSEVVKKELKSENIVEKFEYDDSGYFVHVLLPEGYNDMIETLSIEWSISKRKVAHRLVKNYLWRMNGGIQIMFYNN